MGGGEPIPGSVDPPSAPVGESICSSKDDCILTPKCWKDIRGVRNTPKSIHYEFTDAVQQLRVCGSQWGTGKLACEGPRQKWWVKGVRRDGQAVGARLFNNRASGTTWVESLERENRRDRG